MGDINCRFCESAIFEEKIDVAKQLAVCGHCDGVFSLVDDISDQADEALPSHMFLEQEENELYVAEKWFRPIHLIYIAAVLLLVAGYVAFRVFVMQQFVTANFKRYPAYISLLQLVFIVGIVGLVYLLAAQFFNTTQVNVDRGKLTLRHGPIAWPGGRSIDYDILDDILSTKKGVRYALLALLKSGERLAVLRRITRPEQALFIERKIEKILIRE